MNWGKWLDYLYPPRCPVCDRIYADGICADCRKKLFVITEDFCMKCGKPLEDTQREYCPDCSRKRHVFRQNRALLSYRGPVKLSLYRMKYANRRVMQKFTAGKWQFDWDHGFAGARLQGSYRCRCTENGSENAGTIQAAVIAEIYGAGITSSCR